MGGEKKGKSGRRGETDRDRLSCVCRVTLIHTLHSAVALQGLFCGSDLVRETLIDLGEVADG